MRDTPPTTDSSWTFSRLLVGSLLAIVLLLAALVVFGFFFDDDDVGGVGVTIGDVTGEPEQYAGERVVVSGVVQEQIGDRLFTIGDEELLVLSESATELPEAAVAQVEGTVDQVSGDDLAADLENAIPDETLDALGDDELTVLRASALVLNPFEGDDEGLVEEGALATTEEGALSVNQIVSDGEALLGQEVTVAGELGSAILGEHLAVFDGSLYGTQDLPLLFAGTAPGVFPVTATAPAARSPASIRRRSRSSSRSSSMTTP